MDPLTFILVALLAVGIGTLASLFGIGGGFLLLPTMIVFLGMSEHVTVGTIPLVIIFMSLSSTIAYWRQKRVDFIVTGIIASATVGGSIAGALVVDFVPGPWIVVLFGIVEAILALILGLKKTPAEKALLSKDGIKVETEAGGAPAARNKQWHVITRHHVDKEGISYTYSANLAYSLPLSFLAGFLSSLLGIGGGTLYIQIYVFLCGMSIHMAIASSMASIFLSGVSSFATFAVKGQVDYLVAIAYGIGMLAGAQVGAAINKKIHSKYLKPLAAIMILVIAVRMIIFALIG